MLDDVYAFIDEAAGRLNIPPEVLDRLKTADHKHIFDISLSSGKSFKAYRVQHSNKRGPYKGGVRFHRDVSLEEVSALAILMSLKTAAVNIPMGGGKGGVTVDPKELSSEELEELSRRYVAKLHQHIGPDKDVPAPDVNTDATIMDWMLDEYARLSGHTSQAAFTGKSLANGGSLGREAATGRGGVVTLAKLFELEGRSEQAISYAIQGYGNVGSYFALTAKQLQPNWRLVAASDSEAAVYNPDGLDAAKLQEYKAERGRFKDYQESAEIISNEDMLGLKVDVIVLAGLEDAVTKQNMKDIKAKLIVEMANNPVTAEASNYLASKGVQILPDIIANSGGVIVSYLEWRQNKLDEHWSEEKVNQKMADYLERAISEIYKYSKATGTDLKAAAFGIAIKRLTS